MKRERYNAIALGLGTTKPAPGIQQCRNSGSACFAARDRSGGFAPATKSTTACQIGTLLI